MEKHTRSSQKYTQRACDLRSTHRALLRRGGGGRRILLLLLTTSDNVVGVEIVETRLTHDAVATRSERHLSRTALANDALTLHFHVVRQALVLLQNAQNISFFGAFLMLLYCRRATRLQYNQN